MLWSDIGMPIDGSAQSKTPSSGKKLQLLICGALVHEDDRDMIRHHSGNSINRVCYIVS